MNLTTFGYDDWMASPGALSSEPAARSRTRPLLILGWLMTNCHSASFPQLYTAGSLVKSGSDIVNPPLESMGETAKKNVVKPPLTTPKIWYATTESSATAALWQTVRGAASRASAPAKGRTKS